MTQGVVGNWALCLNRQRRLICSTLLINSKCFTDNFGWHFDCGRYYEHISGYILIKTTSVHWSKKMTVPFWRPPGPLFDIFSTRFLVKTSAIDYNTSCTHNFEFRGWGVSQIVCDSLEFEHHCLCFSLLILLNEVMTLVS